MLKVAVFGKEDEKIPEEILYLCSEVKYHKYDLDILVEPLESTPNVILCYPSGEISPLEIAQSLRMNYPENSLFFIATEKKDFDKKKLIKNGFSQAYLLPWEKSDLIRSMNEESIYSVLPELRDYKPIKVVDLNEGVTLGFDLKVFLPRNNKLLHFASAEEPVSSDKLAKLYENQMNTLFIHKDDVKKFHEYTAETFRRLLKPNALSETDKQEKLQFAVRELISDMFIEDTRENTFGKSQALLNEIKEVIKILLADDNKDLEKKLNLALHQEESFYLHLSNVATYAGLFAIVLGFEKPEEMALAGLLHDLGKINLPEEIYTQPMDNLQGEGLMAYKNHPKFSVDIAKLKRIVLSDSVAKAISQHHEAMNGTGYPLGLEGVRISKEGRLLAIANTFDHLTSLKDSQKYYTLREALIKMCDDNSKDPGRMILDLGYLKQLKSFFIK